MAEESNWGEDSLKVKIKKEKDKFMSLSAEEKKQYYKSYYLVPTIIALVVLLVAGLIIKDVFISKKTQIMQGVVINIEVDDDAGKYLSDNMKKAFGISDKKSTVSYKNINFDFIDGEPASNNFNNVMSLDTLIEGKAVGYILCDSEGLEYVKNLDVACNLNDALSEEMLDKISDRLIIAHSDSKKDNIPIGINIYGTKIAKALGIEEKDCNLVLIDESNYTERYDELIEYIFD
ncbi:MAG: hypothetical protein K6G88_05170 [Lachnospiraceae bacterium]|nr:hypothetical protein [Lachnospiraceae bacterium]